MTIPNFDEMTLDEIDAWNAEKKAELRRVQEEYRLSNPARARKVLEAHVEEATRQIEEAAAREGRDPLNQAYYWLTEEAQSQNEGSPGVFTVDYGRRKQATLYLESLGTFDRESTR